ncbi:hypothetical protein SEPCBS57363_003928 [Sporothrix epigloea]|uniref:Uncharacterized protein n=1 Tax=Sporothrix epigloea TaxID=1892477 RepID=A0ABP0DTC8_9PEZI
MPYLQWRLIWVLKSLIVFTFCKRASGEAAAIACSEFSTPLNNTEQIFDLTEAAGLNEADTQSRPVIAFDFSKAKLTDAGRRFFFRKAVLLGIIQRCPLVASIGAIRRLAGMLEIQLFHGLFG